MYSFLLFISRLSCRPTSHPVLVPTFRLTPLFPQVPPTRPLGAPAVPPGLFAQLGDIYRCFSNPFFFWSIYSLIRSTTPHPPVPVLIRNLLLLQVWTSGGHLIVRFFPPLVDVTLFLIHHLPFFQSEVENEGVSPTKGFSDPL